MEKYKNLKKGTKVGPGDYIASRIVIPPSENLCKVLCLTKTCLA